jgi:hypothetical protein
MKKEIWKDVIGYEGLYEVSNLGRVKSLGYNKQRILKQAIRKIGYLQVGLYKNNIGTTKLVHQLVAESFLNHIPKGNTLVVDHINNNKSDNRLKNLQIIPNRENGYKTQGKYSSKYVGVCWDKQEYKWKTQIRINGKLNFLGRFVNEQEASQAYQNRLATL